MSKSALKDLEQLERHVMKRAAELRPLIAEYEELVQVAKRLGVEVPPYEQVVNGTTGQVKPRSAPKRRRPARSSNGAGSSNGTRRKRRHSSLREPMLAIVAAKPGITIRDASGELGFTEGPTTSVYRVASRLVDEGDLVKRDGRLWPKPEAAAA